MCHLGCTISMFVKNVHLVEVKLEQQEKGNHTRSKTGNDKKEARNLRLVNVNQQEARMQSINGYHTLWHVMK